MFLGLSSEGVEALTKTSLDKSGEFDLDYSYRLQLGGGILHTQSMVQ